MLKKKQKKNHSFQIFIFSSIILSVFLQTCNGIIKRLILSKLLFLYWLKKIIQNQIYALMGALVNIFFAMPLKVQNAMQFEK